MSGEEDMSLEKTSFYRQRPISELSSGQSLGEPSTAKGPLPDFIDFLAVTQWRQIDFLPITWQQMLSSLGVGGTARLKQSIVNNKVSLAFKRLHLDNATAESNSEALRILINEISILGHPVIRRLPYFIRLEGICWDFTDGVVPVLVFRKAHHGNLRQFLFSKAGKKINFAQRLRICSEIGSAIMTMHSFHMIHGDLKPENVLIFEDPLNGFMTKVVDFGYSGLSLLRSEDSKFQLPISRPWNAPELTECNSEFSLDGARKADIYSFGLLCLWILFYDRFESVQGDNCASMEDLEWIETLKENDLLYSFAAECSENVENLSTDEIEGLVQFFGWTLATEPYQRQLPNDARAVAEHFLAKQKNAEISSTSNEEITSSATLSSVGIQCEDIEGHVRPFGFIHYYRFKTGSIDLGYDADSKVFNLTDAIPHLVASDYRLWKHIKNSYETRFDSSYLDQSSRADSAFRLALLHFLHLGTSNKHDEAATWLLGSGRSEMDLVREVETIKQVRAVQFIDKEVEIDVIDFVHQYRDLNLLEVALQEYENTAARLEQLFGSGHTLVIRLRLIYARILQEKGLPRQAQATLLALASAAEVEFGQHDPVMLAIENQLVLVYIDLCSWKEAESLQIRVLEKSKKVFGDESEQAQSCMGNLAVLYWNLRKLDKAERLQTEHLELLQRTRGRRHFKTLTRMNNLASTYEYQGRADKALKLKLEALEISKDINGEDDHYTLSLMNNVANNYRRRKKFQEAEKLDFEVVAARKRQLGENHVITLRAMGNLASDYALQGRAEEAEPLERHIVIALSNQLSPLHQDLLTAKNNLAHTLKDLGQVEEAVRMMTEVVSGRTEVLGADHPETKRSSENLQKWRIIIMDA
ncbi:uncharacterized protein PV09_08352 [Verruconis gallopava]|uniref:Protein kinase domain-containing protein n=1 Tax=Verruconis gallopava TaxID=253628 RepID=A0A0D1XCG6_9PEZI|nr:uncharacterized protein PV09_08352 [Verruconis gallopava]KIV99995.1 hypothetical protein PV09_08352 [Verruconis gallopava]